MGKKIVFTKDLKSGHTITSDDITLKSPADGLEPYRWDEFIGKKLKVDVKVDETAALGHI
jgi:sialic acid synthase SpsE